TKAGDRANNIAPEWLAPLKSTRHTIDLTSDTTSIITVDLDGDGDQDLLSSSDSYSEGGIRWFENDGATEPEFSEREFATASGYRVLSVHAEDIDGDGDKDVIASLSDGGDLVWYKNDGAIDPVFTEQVITA